MENPLYVWDFTCHDLDRAVLIKNLQNCAKKWVFQLEKGSETGKLHFQGRISLKVKTRDAGKLNLGIGHVSATHDKDNDFYVTKIETRVEGPWSDKDVVCYIPRDVGKITELRPWQKQLLSIITAYEERKVTVVIDPVGCSGKSTFVRWCMCHKFGQIIPMANDYKDLLRVVMDAPKSPCYFVDMPRAMRKEKLYQFYSAVETIKGGYAFDDRYSFKQELFDPPNVVIFTNSMPDLQLLTRDRWQLFLLQNGVLIAEQGATL